MLCGDACQELESEDGRYSTTANITSACRAANGPLGPGGGGGCGPRPSGAVRAPPGIGQLGRIDAVEAGAGGAQLAVERSEPLAVALAGGPQGVLRVDVAPPRQPDDGQQQVARRPGRRLRVAGGL